MINRFSLRGKGLCAAAAALALAVAGCTADPGVPAPDAALSVPDAAPATPVPGNSAASDRLEAALDQVAEEAELSVAVRDNRTGAAWSYHPEGRYLEASLVKVPILLTLIRQATEEQRQLTADEESLAALMIEYSDNEATSELYDRLGGPSELERTYELIGVGTTEAGEMWGASETTADDQVLIAQTAACGADWLDPDLLAFAVGLMENVCQEQAWGIGAGVAGDGAEVALKNGWLPDDDAAWNVGSAGFIRTGSGDYSIVVLSAGNSTLSEGIDVVESAAAVINGYGAGS